MAVVESGKMAATLPSESAAKNGIKIVKAVKNTKWKIKETIVKD